MRLTYKHPAAIGRPVFVDGKNKVSDIDGLRAVRSAIGTQRLAIESGVSPKTVNGWIEGRRNISLPSLLLLHHFFTEEEITKIVTLA